MPKSFGLLSSFVIRHSSFQFALPLPLFYAPAMKTFGSVMALWLLLMVGCNKSEPTANQSPSEGSKGQSKPVTIARMPKSKGNAYFIPCRKQTDQASKDLAATLLWK